MRKVTSIPEGGTTFNLGPGVKINSITPLGTGNLVIKPISPLEGQTTETIEITEQLVGATFPGFGQTDLPMGTTALPLLVVFANESSQMFPVYVPGTDAGLAGNTPKERTPSRVPLIATITLTSTPKDLGTAAGDAGETSDAAWRLIVPPGGAGALFGTQSNCAAPIPASQEIAGYDVIPSATLSNWWAKSDGADVVVVLLGGKNQ